MTMQKWLYFRDRLTGKKSRLSVAVWDRMSFKARKGFLRMFQPERRRKS